MLPEASPVNPHAVRGPDVTFETGTEWAVKAVGLSKKFGLSLRQSLRYGLSDIATRLLGHASGSHSLREGEFWAVRDVSFVLRPGEALGIMGVNGSGKTTLLRILGGVYSPDVGQVSLRGRVGAMIAAGAGFSPMLSGRENVYVNGALLGLTTREVDDLMEEIIAFSELGRFIDLPTKNYSSGMFVRLGFAIAALTRPDVLLMDEVLAVGDLNFQKKCFDQILRLKQAGTAIILVSHSPGAIWSVCDRGLFMDAGAVIVDGGVEEVIRSYDERNAKNALMASESCQRASETNESSNSQHGSSSYGHSRGGTGDVACTSVILLDESRQPIQRSLAMGESFYIDALLDFRTKQDNLLIRFTVDAVHYRFVATLDSYESGTGFISVEPGRYHLRVKVNAPNFRPGAYTLNLGILRREVGVHLLYWFGASRFLVEHPRTNFLYSDEHAVMHIDTNFRLETVDGASVSG